MRRLRKKGYSTLTRNAHVCMENTISTVKFLQSFHPLLLLNPPQPYMSSLHKFMKWFYEKGKIAKHINGEEWMGNDRY